jgi:hypothetical protein
MSEKIENVSSFGIYTVVKLTPLDEKGNEIPNGIVQYAVMANGTICSGTYDMPSAAISWAEKHKDDLYSVVGVEEDSLPNEAAAKARSDDDTSFMRND